MAVKRSVPVFLRRTLPPRKNSWTIVAVTSAHNAKHNPGAHTGMPSAVVAASVVAVATPGHRNCSRRFRTLDFRHASSGPTPVRNKRMRPIGMSHLLKNGAATVSRCPMIASLSVGNIVPKRTNSAANRSTQLFTRNAASRDTHESSSLRALSNGRR